MAVEGNLAAFVSVTGTPEKSHIPLSVTIVSDGRFGLRWVETPKIVEARTGYGATIGQHFTEPPQTVAAEVTYKHRRTAAASALLTVSGKRPARIDALCFETLVGARGEEQTFEFDLRSMSSASGVQEKNGIECAFRDFTDRTSQYHSSTVQVTLKGNLIDVTETPMLAFRYDDGEVLFASEVEKVVHPNGGEMVLNGWFPASLARSAGRVRISYFSCGGAKRVRFTVHGLEIPDVMPSP